MRLPPLNSLRTFEAAARHMSFTRAAEELHVTQAAVSHQIRQLEEHLGVPLFQRVHRGLLLTDAGQRMLPAVRQAFDLLMASAAEAAATERYGKLTVSIIPSLAAKWLVPRLPRFRDAHPNIDLRISASYESTDFSDGDVDVAIRYGAGHYPHMHVTRLMDEAYFPVCSPTLRNGPPPLRAPCDLRHHMLLHDEHSPGEPNPLWSDWLRTAGANGIDHTRGPVFRDASMMLLAAIAGQGVAMGRAALCCDDVAAGRLVQPFDLVLPAGYAYWIVCPLAFADRPKVRAFREWLLDEVESMASRPVGVGRLPA